PGDKLTLDSKVITRKRHIWKFDVKASVYGDLAISGVVLIHPQAIIDPSAQIHESVSIGPFTIIGPDVSIDEGTVIGPNNIFIGPTKIGKNNRFFHFCTVGEDTPDLKYKGEPTELIIGNNNTFREYSSIHRGTVQDAGKTVIGNNNLIMCYAHVGHDCFVGNHCIM
ncbi:unnamed protein product, partial [Chrysoparadoxa australica]